MRIAIDFSESLTSRIMTLAVQVEQWSEWTGRRELGKRVVDRLLFILKVITNRVCMTDAAPRCLSPGEAVLGS
jgi:hypothetical protein